MTKKKEQDSIADLLKGELREPFTYKGRKDFEFVSALMRYLSKIFPNGVANEDANITCWWKQRTFCIINHDIKKGDDTWYPDALNGKCMIESYQIKGESKEEWRLRKRKLLEYYAPAIAAYHEGMFSCFIKRIDSNLGKKIYNQYFGKKGEEGKDNE